MVNQFDYLSKRDIFSPEAEALVDVETGKRYSYRAFNKRANKVANFLQEVVEFQKGDRLCILAHNSLEYWEAFFGCQKCGGIFSPLNWRLVSRELACLIDDLSASVLLFDSNLADVASVLKQEVIVDHWISLDSKGAGVEDSLAYEDVMSNAASSPPQPVDLSYEDPMGIVYTGGTTGLPKGAMITYRQVAFNTLSTIRDILPGDVYINHLPLFHVGGLYVYAIPLFILGGKVIQMKGWDLDTLIRVINKENPNFFFAVPTQYRMLMNHPDFRSIDFTKARFLTSGGEPLPLDIIKTYQEVHGVKFKQGFGMTEVGPGCFALDPWDAKRKIGSIGTPNFFIDAKVVDPETDKDCSANEVGELLFRGPTVTLGYWNRPELNKTLLDEGGWFRTGDIVYFDDEGYYYVVDRVKDMFISGGENIYPREIEKVLEEHPAIAQVQVIGVADSKWGEVGRAIVVLKSGQESSEEEIINYCVGKLARFKIPKSVRFTESFTAYISGAGKILKRRLREDFGQEEK
ncbi:MAG: long-chain fatty acid--CoA ligase [Candidatus Thorarchaeota archaeon]|nr:MAG: long-chain fatty acid--CoA ligase [Candidatus Thorarchaeota archaeon]